MKKVILFLFLLSVLFIVNAQKQIKVAVVKPYLEGNASALHINLVKQTLVSTIIKVDGYSAFSRNEIDAIFSEQQFQYGGDVNDATRKKLGDMYGADMLCISQIVGSGGELLMSAMLIDVQTAEILSSPEPIVVKATTQNVQAAAKTLAQELLKSSVDVPKQVVVEQPAKPKEVEPAPTQKPKAQTTPTQKPVVQTQAPQKTVAPPEQNPIVENEPKPERNASFFLGFGAGAGLGTWYLRHYVYGYWEYGQMTVLKSEYATMEISFVGAPTVDFAWGISDKSFLGLHAGLNVDDDGEMGVTAVVEYIRRYPSNSAWIVGAGYRSLFAFDYSCADIRFGFKTKKAIFFSGDVFLGQSFGMMLGIGYCFFGGGK